MAEEGHRITNDQIAEAIADIKGISKSDIEGRINVHSFDVTPGSNVGDNFACVMKAVSAQVEVDGKVETFELMGKCIPLNPMREKFVREGDIFQKECLAYTSIIPALEKLQRGKISLALPKCHFSSDSVMLMENLKKGGYELVDKRIGLDLVGIRMLFDQLSMLHAVSHHYLHTYPGGLDALYIDQPHFINNDGWIKLGSEEFKIQFETMLTKTVEGSAGILEKFAPERPILAEKMRNFSKIAFEVMDRVSKINPEKFDVLIHGDCWNNNFMFLYDDSKKLKAMKMVDLQLMRRASPCHDLVYFFCSSTSPELRKDHLNELLQYYHDRLIEHLNALGYPSTVFPFEDLKSEFDKIYPFGFVFGIFAAQIILSEEAAKDGGLMDMNDVTSDEEMNAKMKNMDNLVIKAATGNVALQKRLIGLVEEAIERNII